MVLVILQNKEVMTINKKSLKGSGEVKWTLVRETFLFHSPLCRETVWSWKSGALNWTQGILVNMTFDSPICINMPPLPSPSPPIYYQCCAQNG